MIIKSKAQKNKELINLKLDILFNLILSLYLLTRINWREMNCNW